MKHLDVAAVGTCYVDTNASGFVFDTTGIAAGTETVGGVYETVPGGSAVNFCCMLGSLGLNTAFIGVNGKDAMRDMLARLLNEVNVKTFIAQNCDVQTDVSFNTSSRTGEHIMCVAGSANGNMSFDAIYAELEHAVAD